MKKLLFFLTAFLPISIGLHAQEKKFWDFTKGLSAETVANLNTDTQNWSSNGTDENGVTINWKNETKPSPNVPLKANGVVIEETNGLLFDIGNNGYNSIWLTQSDIRLTRKGTIITFPKLLKGQKVTIVGKASNGTATNRGIAPVQDYLVLTDGMTTNGQCIFLGNQVEGSLGTYSFTWEVQGDGDAPLDVQFQLTEGGINFTLFMINDLPRCATPTISFANGKLMFECETEGVEYVPSISLASSQHSNQIELFSVYRFSVYAKKNGYLDSDVASVNIDLNRLKGDMNNDGAISIADAVAIVNVLLGGNSISLYYSVGTDAVTANNYTTANNAQNVSSLSAIPSTLLTVTTPGVYYILLPDQFEPEVGGVVYYNVTKLNVNIPSYSVYRTASLSAGVQIKRVNVGTSGSQIDYE